MLKLANLILCFRDTVQNALPEFQKDLGLQVHHSNLCSEITLATSAERTAVCCLSSVNLEEYDEWCDNDQFIPDLVRMLDNVLTYFIDNAPDELYRAKLSAERERSIGLGAMGFHAHLQRQDIPFESACGQQAQDSTQCLVELNRRQYVQLNNSLQNAAIVLTRMVSGRTECPFARRCS